MSTDTVEHHYAPLRAILDEALAQASSGKGIERHGRGQSFSEQPMQAITKMVGPGFPLGQAMKKAQEASGMIERGQIEAARAELLGAISYLAGAIMSLPHQHRDAAPEPVLDVTRHIDSQWGESIVRQPMLCASEAQPTPGQYEAQSRDPAYAEAVVADPSVPPVRFRRLHPNAKLPVYATAGASGADVFASKSVQIGFGDRALVPTGLGVELLPGYEIQVRPRSGLALKVGITVMNAPGTVDSDYRGELKIMLINHSCVPFVIQPGDRIAQIVVAPVQQHRFEWTDETTETARGAGGFGSTGTGSMSPEYQAELAAKARGE